MMEADKATIAEAELESCCLLKFNKQGACLLTSTLLAVLH